MDLRKLQGLAEHCSNCERRAEAAERKLVKRRILAYLADRVGDERLRLDLRLVGLPDRPDQAPSPPCPPTQSRPGGPRAAKPGGARGKRAAEDYFSGSRVIRRISSSALCHDGAKVAGWPNLAGVLVFGNTPSTPGAEAFPGRLTGWTSFR